MTTREQFEAQFRDYEMEHLELVVEKALKVKLETLVKLDGVRKTLAKLLDELEQVDLQLKDFLFYFFNGPKAMRNAAIEYYTERFNIPVPVTDPYTDLVIFNDAFVDRQDLRDKLKLFFNCNTHQLLSTRGPRYSGRTHSASFVKYVARKEDYQDVPIDLLDNTPDDVMDEIINQMRLPAKEFNDRMAQEERKVKTFIAALKGILTDAPYNTKKYCLIFDHHDRDEVIPDTRKFVETLVEETAKNNYPNNFRIILVGQGSWVKFPRNLHAKVMDVPAPYLVPGDIEKYLKGLAKQNAEDLQDEELEKRKEEVLDKLNLTELDGITTMSERLRKYFNS